MSDAVQLPPSLPVVPRVAPVRPAEHIDPPKKSQTENHNSSDQRESPTQDGASSANDRHLTITRDKAMQAFVYRYIEADTGEVVWQWPAEEILRRAHHMREMEEQLRHEVDQKA